MTKLTFKGVAAELRAIGITLRHDLSLGEYQVRYKGDGPDAASTYFTGALDDALHTGRAMTTHRAQLERAAQITALGFVPDAKPTTSRTVNAVLRAMGHAERLVRGRGYWYFVDGEAMSWFSSSVPVCRIDDLSIVQWLNYRDALAADARNVR